MAWSDASTELPRPLEIVCQAVERRKCTSPQAMAVGPAVAAAVVEEFQPRLKNMDGDILQRRRRSIRCCVDRMQNDRSRLNAPTCSR